MLTVDCELLCSSASTDKLTILECNLKIHSGLAVRGIGFADGFCSASYTSRVSTVLSAFNVRLVPVRSDQHTDLLQRY